MKILGKKYEFCEALAVQLPLNWLSQDEEWNCCSQALGIYVQASAIGKKLKSREKKITD